MRGLLGRSGRQLDAGVPKATLIAAPHQLQAYIGNCAVEMESTDQGEARSEAEVLQETEKDVCEALRETSVAAWVMKPLVCTLGMK